jgi:3-hydroxy-9,10-secoandrosta-1,3,5(10)-triene-9,17-dione monooxygenase reductase component
MTPHRFRQVLGTFPTGVTVVTAIAADGRPTGMAVGSFTSVSLDPPLVAFLPACTSTSFPRIRTARSFCVNVLGEHQEDLCRVFASSGGDKFAGVPWSPTPSGAPRLHGVEAWIDCSPYRVTTAGDHYLVIGRVDALDSTDAGRPMIFHRGRYGRITALAAPG